MRILLGLRVANNKFNPSATLGAEQDTNKVFLALSAAMPSDSSLSNLIYNATAGTAMQLKIEFL